eukprot:2388098-Pleurochrysis_carterae.AAC.1
MYTSSIEPLSCERFEPPLGTNGGRFGSGGADGGADRGTDGGTLISVTLVKVNCPTEMPPSDSV